MARIDPDERSGRELYRLMISLLVPRPIAWVGSRSAEGRDNLAPFSYFTGVTARPMRLAISVARGPRGVLKDTARNILETRQFTVSLVSQELARDMVYTSGSFAPEVDEFEEAGLEKVQGERVAAAWPAAARVSFECELEHAHDFGNAHLLVGRVLLLHARDEVLRTDAGGRQLAELRALDPVSRLGGEDYATVGEVFQVPRPVVTRPGDGS